MTIKLKSKNQRNKFICSMFFCNIRLKIIRRFKKIFNDINIVILKRYDDCSKHNHNLKYTNSMKIDDEIKEIVIKKIIKEYIFANINKLL